MKKLCCFIIICFSLCTCRKADIGDINNLNGGKIILLGHAGLGFADYTKPYPDNSAISIERAIDGFNADGVEVDIQLSADSAIFLFHDDLMESATDCYGCLTEYTAQQLDNCRYKENFSISAYQNEKLYTLDAMLSKYSGYRDVYFLLDIKYYTDCTSNFDGDYGKALFSEIARLATKYNVAERTFVEVASGAEVPALKLLESDIRILCGIKYPDKELKQVSEAGADGIIIRNDRISKEQVKIAHRLGLMVSLFSVESKSENIDAVEKHPDIILSDNIRLTQEVVAGY